MVYETERRRAMVPPGPRFVLSFRELDAVVSSSAARREGERRHAVRERREEEERRKKEGRRGRPQERPLSSTSARVLAALMETRSRELPLTAAKPIYLRPRSLLSSPFSVPGSPVLPLGPPRAALPRASFFLRPSRMRYSPLARAPSGGPPTRLQRGSCLTRGYFTFPCSPGRRSRRVAGVRAIRVQQRVDARTEQRVGSYPSSCALAFFPLSRLFLRDNFFRAR